jgi:hypothetical protein
MDDVKMVKKSNKGKIDISEFKRGLNLTTQPHINSITCNQTQEYFAVATNIGFEII